MSNVTKNNLIAEIESLNKKLLESGSEFFYRYGHRNNVHVVDLYKLSRICAEKECNKGVAFTQDHRNPIVVCEEQVCGGQAPVRLIERLQAHHVRLLGLKG